MSKKPSLTNLTTMYNAAGTISENNDKIEASFENTISRDGSTPNNMLADLDMDGNDILNANLVQVNDLSIAGENVNGIITTASEKATEATNSAAAALTSETNASTSANEASVSSASAATSADAAALFDGPWLDNVAELLADTLLTYTTGTPQSVAVGAYVQTRAEGFSYEVAASDATDEHVTTAGGVKLYVLSGPLGFDVASYGAIGDGSADDTAEINAAMAAIGDTVVSSGTYLITDTVTLAEPKVVRAAGPHCRLVTNAGFAALPILSVAPVASDDPKGWTVQDLSITNNGAATEAVLIDLALANEYVSKFTLSRIVSNAQTDYFLRLLNSIPNQDGLFTSVISDNWSLGGYRLENVGDSLHLLRNTTTGAGDGYYVNQLDTAANIKIADGNCTSLGNALNVVRGANIAFDNMQCECTGTFTGVNDAMISFAPSSGSAVTVFNAKITNCNVNTQGNVDRCIYVEYADQVIIDGCELYCDPATQSHIVIGANARNVIIGNNKYYSSVDGNEIDPVIVNDGIGTVGVWVDATLTLAGWSAQNTVNEHTVGFFKDRDGTIHLRGRVAGAATTGGETLFTLPVGYRPKSKGYLIGTYGSGAGNTTVLQIIPAGQVQILTAGQTGAYLSGVTFSGK